MGSRIIKIDKLYVFISENKIIKCDKCLTYLYLLSNNELTNKPSNEYEVKKTGIGIAPYNDGTCEKLCFITDDENLIINKDNVNFKGNILSYYDLNIVYYDKHLFLVVEETNEKIVCLGGCESDAYKMFEPYFEDYKKEKVKYSLSLSEDDTFIIAMEHDGIIFKTLDLILGKNYKVKNEKKIYNYKYSVEVDISDCFLRNQNNMIYLMSNHNNNLVITHGYVKIE